MRRSLVLTQRRMMSRNFERLQRAIEVAEDALANGRLAEAMDEEILPALRAAALELVCVTDLRTAPDKPAGPVTEAPVPVTEVPPAPADAVGFTHAARSAAAIERAV